MATVLGEKIASGRPIPRQLHSSVRRERMRIMKQGSRDGIKKRDQFNRYL